MWDSKTLVAFLLLFWSNKLEHWCNDWYWFWSFDHDLMLKFDKYVWFPMNCFGREKKIRILNLVFFCYLGLRRQLSINSSIWYSYFWELMWVYHFFLGKQSSKNVRLKISSLFFFSFFSEPNGALLFYD